MGADVSNLYTCACGAPARPFRVTWYGEDVSEGPLCDGCRIATERVLERLRPVYLSIRLAGLDHDIASDTLTFLLDRMDRAGAPTGAIRP